MKRAARIYRGTKPNLAFLAARLRAGELVAVPTETVYGLAADALSAQACRKIFAAKGRPASDPLIVHLFSVRELPLVAEASGPALRLAKKFWPGPLTLVLPKTPAVPAVVSSGRPSVAVRVPGHPLFRRLLKLTGRPLAAPSANLFGYISPTTAEHVRHGLGHRIRHILDGGPARIGVESTILDLRDPRRPRLLRPGKITRAQLERVLGVPVAAPDRSRPSSARAHLAPGQFARHYSPRTPVELHPRIAAKAASRGSPAEAWLYCRRPISHRKSAPAGNIFWLDGRGRLPGVARQLFAVLRKIDGMGFSKIHAELAPGGGLAEAINDRLRRAAARG